MVREQIPRKLLPFSSIPLRARPLNFQLFVIWNLTNCKRSVCNHRVTDARGRLLNTKEALESPRAPVLSWEQVYP